MSKLNFNLFVIIILLLLRQDNSEAAAKITDIEQFDYSIDILNDSVDEKRGYKLSEIEKQKKKLAPANLELSVRLLGNQTEETKSCNSVDINIDSSKENLNRLLLESVKQRKAKLIPSLIKRGADINALHNGETPLSFIIKNYKDDDKIVMLLLAYGSSLNLIYKTSLDDSLWKDDDEIRDMTIEDLAWHFWCRRSRPSYSIYRLIKYEETRRNLIVTKRKDELIKNLPKVLPECLEKLIASFIDYSDIAQLDIVAIPDYVPDPSETASKIEVRNCAWCCILGTFFVLPILFSR